MVRPSSRHVRPGGNRPDYTRERFCEGQPFRRNNIRRDSLSFSGFRMVFWTDCCLDRLLNSWALYVDMPFLMSGHSEAQALQLRHKSKTCFSSSWSNLFTFSEFVKNSRKVLARARVVSFSSLVDVLLSWPFF